MKANLSWITEELATGGDLSPDPTEAFGQVEDIIGQGISLVVDMRSEANDAVVWDTVDEVRYFHVPTHDGIGYRMPHEAFDQVVAAVREHWLTNGAWAKVLVHCHMGINRGPSGAFAVMLDWGKDPLVAFDLIRKARPIAGIAYAEDALYADHRRRKARGQQVEARDVKRLERHIRAVMTPAVQRRIEHKIRDLHAEDAERWERLAETIRSMR